MQRKGPHTENKPIQFDIQNAEKTVQTPQIILSLKTRKILFKRNSNAKHTLTDFMITAQKGNNIA